LSAAAAAGARDFLEKLWHNKYVDEVVLPYAVTADEVKRRVMPLVEIEIQKGSKQSVDVLFAEIRDTIYNQYDPESLFGTKAPKTMRYAQEHGDLWLPKEIVKTTKQLLEPKMPGPVGKFGAKTTSIFKTAVLSLSPKHLVNQAVADNMWLLMRGGAEELNPRRWLEAMRAVKRGEMPIELSTHIDPLTGDQLWNQAVGSKLARLLKDGNGDPRKIFTATGWSDLFNLTAETCPGSPICTAGQAIPSMRSVTRWIGYSPKGSGNFLVLSSRHNTTPRNTTDTARIHTATVSDFPRCHRTMLFTPPG